MKRFYEWQTFAVLIICYASWALATTVLAAMWLPLGIVVAGIAIGLHSSLQHEVLHGHPTRNAWLNEALVFPAIGLLIPYIRFRDTHLAHHHDANLTDPYDDPESNYQDPAVWGRASRAVQAIYTFNNTLLGRFVLGPTLSMIGFVKGDLRLARGGDDRVIRGWLWHIPALVPVFVWLIYVGQMPLWAYAIAAYLGFAQIKIRTFLEHQAHERASGRTVIVEDRGILAFLFLNNNLHAVHHIHPRVAWYDLPALYDSNKDHYVTRNHGYVYRSYGQIIRRHFLRTKDPVPHPFWR